MRVLAHTLILLGNCLTLNTDAMRTPGIPTGGPCAIITLPDGYNPVLLTNLEHLARTRACQSKQFGAGRGQFPQCRCVRPSESPTCE